MDWDVPDVPAEEHGINYTIINVVRDNSTRPGTTSDVFRTKPVKNPIAAWETEKSLFDDTDLVGWVKQVAGKSLNGQDYSRPKDDFEDSVIYRVDPNRKCPTIGNHELFHQESLHRRFCKRSESPPNPNFKQKPGYTAIVAPPTKRGKKEIETELNLKYGTKALSEGDNVSTKGLTNDKIDLRLELNDDEKTENDMLDAQATGALRRSRSVPVCKSLMSDTARLKRLLRFAKHTNTNEEENGIKKGFDEDEGYASKTSSAEDQLSKTTDGYELHVIGTRPGLGAAEGRILFSGTADADSQQGLALPLGELIPAMDRSMKNTPRSPRGGNLNSAPTGLNDSGGENSTDKNTPQQRKDGDVEYTFPSSETKHALLKSSTDLLGRTIGQAIGPPSFRGQRQKSPLQRAKDSTERRLGAGGKQAKENSDLAPPLVSKPNQNTPRMRMVSTKPKPGLENGFKLPINPERGRKKRMEDTFLKFYNGRCPYDMHRALTEELNFMLNIK
ncbi:hypothetical protein ScPMuIL_006078 [Solemya velum]